MFIRHGDNLHKLLMGFFLKILEMQLHIVGVAVEQISVLVSQSYVLLLLN